MSQPRILIVHADAAALALLSSMLKSLGHVIEEAPNDRVAVRQLERGGIDMILEGADPADADALELLSYVRRKHRHVPVILLFPKADLERTREALRMGALSVLRYPVPATELRAAVTQAFGAISQSDPVQAPQANLNHLSLLQPGPFQPVGGGGLSPHHYGQATSTTRAQSLSPVASPISRAEQLARELGMVGTHPNLRLVIESAGTIAANRNPVLIVGECGTGKALLARTIHALGSQADQPFVTIDCAALTEATFERNRDPVVGSNPADLSFDWTSKIAHAQGGTLFLNDVAALSEALQLQLLRALNDCEADCRTAPHSDVRFLMSSCDNLMALVEQKVLRQDLYYRASAFSLKLPPLRHRGGDVELIAEYFRARFSLELGKNVDGFSRDAFDLLNKHDWPGNIRELEAVVQRGVALCQGTRITSGHLASSLSQTRPSRPSAFAARSATPSNIRPLKEALEEPEKRIIIQALQALNWNRQETARILDINRTTLYKKMKKYGLLVDEPIWVN